MCFGCGGTEELAEGRESCGLEMHSSQRLHLCGDDGISLRDLAFREGEGEAGAG